MRFLRSSFFCSSSAASMAAVFAVAAAITFTPMITLAESGPPPISCDSEDVTTCIDAGLDQACGCGARECACLSSRCMNDGGPLRAPVCTPIVTCRQMATEPCANEADGSRCMLTPDAAGMCVTIDCLELNDGGIYENVWKLECRVPVGDGEIPGSGARDPADRRDHILDSGTNGGCGCFTAPVTNGVMAGAPLALLALAALRRRRNRK